QIMVDLDPQALLAKGLSAQDVNAAINAQNLTLPTGTAKIGPREYTVSLNSSPDAVDALNNIPIRRVGDSMGFRRDRAHRHGGFALAVGILVDDATVEIENIHRNLAMGKRLRQAILDGAQQIAVPAFVATLSISIVFVSVLFLDGAPRYLFTPMALAVGFSVMASYFLSRTVVPTMVQYLLPAEIEAGHAGPSGALGRFHEAFNRGFERARGRYVEALGWTLGHRRAVFAVFGVTVASAAILLPFVGRDFFPKVDAGQIRLHVTAPAGTRIEETERYFTDVE